MSLRSSASQIRCTLWKAAKAANRVVSRAPMTHTFHSDTDPEHDFVCSFEKLSRPVDLDLLAQFQVHGCPGIAVALFLEMLRVGIAPAPFSVSAVLVGCSQLGAKRLGTQVHGLSLKAGFCYNVVVGTGLVDMYSKCCSVDDSRLVFDQMLDKNILSWSSMVTGYAQNQQPDEAMVLVKDMLHWDLKPNYVTYNSLLSLFYSPNYLDHCKQIHCRVIQDGLESNAYIVVTLAIAYSECGGSLEEFQKICLSVTKWDQIS
nr:pentatricopeptide repeat-containing protein [Quercus suber]